MSQQPKQKPGVSKQDYATPAVFLDAVKARLGITEFVIDLAASAENTKAHVWFDEQRDALSVPRWEFFIQDGWAWLNPPFAQIAPWARKCAETVARSDAKIAFLVPAAVGSNWYRDYMDGQHAHVLFLNGRIPFMPDKPKWLYPKDCILVLYGLGYQGSSVWTWRSTAKRRVA